ncbi:hypothetical protein [Streptomyces sp. NPDC058476]|uniref:hypothetical protein n=1 Tax=Streptomyces sp. NPDC058476 TaxID=3346519 RepID=UPI00366696E2
MAAFVRACGASAEEQRDAWGLWQAARAEHRGILATLQAPPVPNIRTPQDLNAALAAAYERAGSVQLVNGPPGFAPGARSWPCCPASGCQFPSRATCRPTAASTPAGRGEGASPPCRWP